MAKQKKTKKLCIQNVPYDITATQSPQNTSPTLRSSINSWSRTLTLKKPRSESPTQDTLLKELIEVSNLLETLHLQDVKLGDLNAAKIIYEGLSQCQNLYLHNCGAANAAIQALVDKSTKLKECKIIGPTPEPIDPSLIIQFLETTPSCILFSADIPEHPQIKYLLHINQKEAEKSTAESPTSPTAPTERQFKKKLDGFRKSMLERNPDSTEALDPPTEKVALYKTVAPQPQPPTPQVAPPLSCKMAISQAASIGRRDEMQDSTVIVTLGDGIGDWIAIYDGHGSRSAADYVALNLHPLFVAELSGLQGKEMPIEDKITEAAVRAFKKCHSRMVGWAVSFGTTALVVLLRPPHLVVINLGDSRCYLNDKKMWLQIKNHSGVDEKLEANQPQSQPVDNQDDPEATVVPSDPAYEELIGKLLCTTRDHRPTDTREYDAVYDRGGMVDGDRVSGIISVSRALGDGALAMWLGHEPEVTTYLWQGGDGDICMVLGCDGIWEGMSGAAAMKIALNVRKEENMTDASRADKAAEQLITAASDGESMDNLTVIVAYMNGYKTI